MFVELLALPVQCGVRRLACVRPEAGPPSDYRGGVPVDPAPFLSTVILASAALVAIVGGLLVARFVGLDSDQLTSRKLIADAEDRLAVARRRADAAQRDLIRWEAWDFLGEDVAKAIATGQTDVRELRKLAPLA